MNVRTLWGTSVVLTPVTIVGEYFCVDPKTFEVDDMTLHSFGFLKMHVKTCDGTLLSFTEHYNCPTACQNFSEYIISNEGDTVEQAISLYLMEGVVGNTAYLVRVVGQKIEDSVGIIDAPKTAKSRADFEDHLEQYIDRNWISWQYVPGAFENEYAKLSECRKLPALSY